MGQAPQLGRRTIRRQQLIEIVPLGDSTISDMEQRGEFPQRCYLTSRCVVWDLATGHLSSIRTATTLRPFAAILRDRAVRNWAR
jgi:predicted DNA-binding transcriptional regulator AlpA